MNLDGLEKKAGVVVANIFGVRQGQDSHGTSLFFVGAPVSSRFVLSPLSPGIHSKFIPNGCVLPDGMKMIQGRLVPISTKRTNASYKIGQTQMSRISQ